MIDKDDLWIGDFLKLKKSGRIGKFDGFASNNKIRIKLENKTILTTISNVEITEDQPNTSHNFIPRPATQKKKATSLEASIDLHLETLAPSMLNTRPERILDYQLDKAKQFIEASIDNKVRKIEIIHGKGEGVLKMEILHLLSNYKEVQFTFDKNQGGCTEIWLKA